MPFPKLIDSLPEFKGRFDARRLDAENCTVLFASYPAGTEIEMHSHDTENIGVITEGELILTVNGIASRYGPGDWYHLAPGEPHEARFAVPTAEVEFWFTPGD